MADLDLWFSALPSQGGFRSAYAVLSAIVIGLAIYFRPTQ
jgi:hypothetical protein